MCDVIGGGTERSCKQGRRHQARQRATRGQLDVDANLSVGRLPDDLLRTVRAAAMASSISLSPEKAAQLIAVGSRCPADRHVLCFQPTVSDFIAETGCEWPFTRHRRSQCASRCESRHRRNCDITAQYSRAAAACSISTASSCATVHGHSSRRWCTSPPTRSITTIRRIRCVAHPYSCCIAAVARRDAHDQPPARMR